MDIIEEIKEFVENECKKPSSKYGYDPFSYHLIPMVNYAKELTEKLGGNKEVILISAWLHDIGSIIHGRKDHHITSTKIAEEKLKELKYPSEKIELVKKCIFNHRGSIENKIDSIEEQIIIEADAISNFDDIAGLFKVALIHENKSRNQAKDSVREKLKRKYKQLHFEKSKEIIKPKYEAAMLLLK